VLEKGIRKPRTPRSVGFPGLDCQWVKWKGSRGHKQRRLARSPFAALGWKKSRSYCSEFNWRVI
jgi:hypothetical protein